MKRMLALTAAMAAHLYGGVAQAQSSAGAPKNAFYCSLGKKQVSVEVVGDQIIYRFGTPEKIEMSIVGSETSNNVHYYSRSASDLIMEQVRFSNGTYSYIVHAIMPRSNEAEAGSGLVVMNGEKVIANFHCTKASRFGVDLSGLPEDDEAFDTLAL